MKTVDVRIEDRWTDNGHGRGHVEGCPVDVVGALPGERVTAKIQSRHRGVMRAVLEEVLEPHPHRVSPRCPYVLRCGGCTMQHLAVDYQQVRKQEVFADLLSQYQLPNALEPILTAPACHYRRKGRLSARYVDKKGRLLLGFREKDGRKIMDMNTCDVIDQRIADAFQPLTELIASLSVVRCIPQVEFACGDEQVAIVLRHLQPLSAEDMRHLEQFAQQHQWWIYLQSGAVYDLKAVDAAPHDGLLSYHLSKCQLELFFHVQDFIQVNQAINEQMVAQALGWLQLQRDDIVLDAYCGIGNLTLPLATQVDRCIGIDINEQALKRARFNAEHNQLNIDFYAVDCDNLVQTQAWLDPMTTALVLDPSRRGALSFLQEVVPQLPRLQQILYISCQSTTQVVDAVFLRQQGFELMKTGVMDMFPHTDHFESMMLFAKAEH